MSKHSFKSLAHTPTGSKVCIRVRRSSTISTELLDSMAISSTLPTKNPSLLRLPTMRLAMDSSCLDGLVIKNCHNR